jgi:LuxR family maltose regulon positive regulatory protein
VSATSLPLDPFDPSAEADMQVPTSRQAGRSEVTHTLQSVTRSRLVNRLRVAQDTKVVLVTAPAGYGKTTVVEAWARRDGRRFAWIDREAFPDPHDALAALAAAAIRAATGAAVVEAPSGSREHVFAVMGRELREANAPVVLVVDNARLSDGAVHTLSLIAAELPAGSQIVLVSRRRPPIEVARVRAEGQLLEIDVTDLRFTDREAAALARSAGVELSRSTIESLNRELEGWPQGWQLVLNALRTGGATGSDPGLPEIFSYLREEALATLDDEQLHFLRRVAPLDRLCAVLCEAVTDEPGAGALLTELARSGAFVEPLDREGRWFRLHPLMRRLLRVELDRVEPGQSEISLRRASDWCQRYGSGVLALDYASELSDQDQLVAVLERYALPFAPAAPAQALERWLAPIDDDLLEARPAIAATAALTWAVSGLAGEAFHCAQALELAGANGSA